MFNSFLGSSFGFTGFLLFLLISIVLFLLFREVTLWYFKINENTDSLRRIADSLEEISATLAADEIVTEETIINDKDSSK